MNSKDSTVDSALGVITRIPMHKKTIFKIF